MLITNFIVDYTLMVLNYEAEVAMGQRITQRHLVVKKSYQSHNLAQILSAVIINLRHYF